MGDILDELYGDTSVIRSKLKDKILTLQLKATKSPEREIELFDSIQYISSRIKAAEGTNMLEADQEYIALVSKHLSSDDLKNWVKIRSNDWGTFYSFLESLSKDARAIQVLHETRNGFNVSQPPKTCDHCNGDHASRFCKKQKPKTDNVPTVGETKTCKVCDQDAHFIKLGDKSIRGDRAINCPKFKSVDQAGKTALLQETKKKIEHLCKHCSGFTHKSESCYKKLSCNICP